MRSLLCFPASLSMELNLERQAAMRFLPSAIYSLVFNACPHVSPNLELVAFAFELVFCLPVGLMILICLQDEGVAHGIMYLRDEFFNRLIRIPLLFPCDLFLEAISSLEGELFSVRC